MQSMLILTDPESVGNMYCATRDWGLGTAVDAKYASGFYCNIGQFTQLPATYLPGTNAQEWVIGEPCQAVCCVILI